MSPEKISFLQNKFIELLRNANPDTPARWGKISFQHMVEHFVLCVKNANGKLKTDHILTPADKLPAFQEFIMSEKDFRENTKSPAFPEEPLALHFRSVEEGINKLEREIKDFFHIYEATPGLKIRNPVFGDLDYEHAVNLLYKHALHHARQFGLLN